MSERSSLQSWTDLVKYEKGHEGYDEEMEVDGARISFRFRVFGKPAQSQGSSDRVPHCTLTNNKMRDVMHSVREGLEAWANKPDVHMWSSDVLPLHLNIPIRDYPSDVQGFLQVLLVGSGLPTFVLTMYEGTTGDAHEALDQFSQKTVRMLMPLLMNYCHEDFILLPCTLAYDDSGFSREAFEEQLAMQQRLARDYYGGPSRLSEDSFHALTRAVQCVMGATTVPFCLNTRPDRQKPWLQMLSIGSQNAMLELVQQLSTSQNSSTDVQRLTYANDFEAKMKTVVLEAARRLSFRHKVTIVTKNQDIMDCVRKMADLDYEHHRLKPEISATKSDRRRTAKGITIAVDASCADSSRMDLLLTKDEPPSTQRQKAHNETSRHHVNLVGNISSVKQQHDRGTLHFVLLGKPGAGRSATGNSLLGKNVFTSHKKYNQQDHTDFEGTRIEVFKPRSSDSVDALRSKTYDTVLYVINIKDRPTRDHLNALKRIKACLGSDALQRTVVVFSHCGQVSEDAISHKMDQFKTLLDVCEKYFIFNHEKPEVRSEFLRFVRGGARSTGRKRGVTQSRPGVPLKKHRS